MSLRKFLVLLIAFGCFAFQAEAKKAGTPGYDAIYVFGDSFSDVGNIFALTGGATPPAPYYRGRFSDGPIWLDHVASAWGLPMEPSLLGGTNYAFGGAKVLSAAGSIPSVQQQVALYLAQHGGKADPRALYVIEGGSNDIFASLLVGSPQVLGHDIAVGLVKAIAVLREAGAKDFLVPNVLNAGLAPKLAPFPPAVAAFATAATVAANRKLTALLAEQEGRDDVHIHRADLFGVTGAIVADATHFGFTDITHSCLDAVKHTVCADPARTLFWDTVHPTEFGHAISAVTVVASLSPLLGSDDDEE